MSMLRKDCNIVKMLFVIAIVLFLSHTSYSDISTLRVPIGGESLKQRLSIEYRKAQLERAATVNISASLLSVENSADYPEQSIRAIRAGATMIHLDIIGDKGKATAVAEAGSADTSQAFTPDAIRAIKAAAQKQGVEVPIDCHVMYIEPSEAFIGSYLDAGADKVSLHWEAFSDKRDLLKMLKYIKSRKGVEAGIALRPDANIKDIAEFILKNREWVDYVSQSGIKPCLGGQIFTYSVLDNIEYLNRLRQEKNLSFKIMVDGGIEPESSGRKAVWAGADILVAGSAIFGLGHRSEATMESAIRGLRSTSEIEETSIYDIMASEIAKLRSQKPGGKLWIRISGYHGGGKTYTAATLRERLSAMGLKPVEVGLDISWTDRSDREKGKEEAATAGSDHAYFDGMTHWRKKHSERAIEQLELQNGVVEIADCYDFDTGATTQTRKFDVEPESIMLVDGVYADSIDRKWDLAIHIVSDQEDAKTRAMERDAVKVHRPEGETRALYEKVYEPTYAKYEAMFRPRETADVVIDATHIDNPKIVNSKIPLMILECTKCSHQYPVKGQPFCSHCGQELAMQIVGPVDFMGSIDDTMKGMWRFHRLMPIAPEYIVTDGEGDTPVIYMKEVSERLGIRLYIKMETVNPTGTFKDREASYVMSSSRQEGLDNVVMQSTGNTAIAMTHYAGLAGMRSWAFVPESSRYKLLMPPRMKNNHIIAVRGHPKDTKGVAEDFAAHYGFPKVSPFWKRCEANATQAYEICAGILEGQLPNFDFYVQTIAAGMGPIGFQIGVNRVSQWTHGAVAVPRVLAVEIDEFAPIQHAWDQGLEEVGENVATPLFPSTPLFEPTLWTTNIRKYYPFLREMLLKTNGMLMAVSPEEVMEYIQKYGILDELRSMGYPLTNTEQASFVSFTGLAKKVESGAIPKGSKVILMLTGKGMQADFSLTEPDTIVNADTDLSELSRIVEGHEPIAELNRGASTDL